MGLSVRGNAATVADAQHLVALNGRDKSLGSMSRDPVKCFAGSGTEVGMPKMDWELFQRDHYRPHLLIVVAKSERNAAEKQADFERLAVKLEAAGNYAFKAEGDSIYAAFESEADASRFSVLFRAKQTTRELDWSSKSLAHLDRAISRRISTILKSSSGFQRGQFVKSRQDKG
jgi:hypothetical protein